MELSEHYQWLVTGDNLFATMLTPLGDRIMVRDAEWERAVVLQVTTEQPRPGDVATTLYANGQYVDFGEDFIAILGIFDEVQQAEPGDGEEVELQSVCGACGKAGCSEDS